MKRELKHGELGKWIDSKTNVSKQWAAFARRSAEQFIKDHGEQSLLLLCNPSAEADQTERVLAEQQMMEFTGGKGPSALLDALGIKKRSTSKSGDDEPLAPGETAAHLAAKGVVGELQDKLFQFCLNESTMQLQHLKLHELEKLHGTLLDSTREVAALIKQG